MDKRMQSERWILILDIIRAEKSVRVEDLACRLNVSENTIRRDLNNLAHKDMIERTKGGALSRLEGLSEKTFSSRQDKNRENKERIAEKAVALINRGDTIILDGGTTSVLLAEKILDLDHVTVITNSLDVAQILTDSQGITLVVSGGILNRDSRTMTGFPAEKFFSEVNADKLFLAVTGISTDQGYSDQNMHETPVKLKMIDRSREVYVLGDSSKFGKSAFSPIGDLSIAQLILTDKKPDPHISGTLNNLGVKLIIC